MDRKGSRNSRKRASRPIKRRAPPNRHKVEQDQASTSASAKKLKLGEYNDVIVDPSFGYRILNFVTVFSSISDYVKCKNCGGDIKFAESSIRGLGFKIVIQCVSCDPISINSCPTTENHSYEINRRLVFAMRVLGIGFQGINKFCGLMDLPKPVFRTTYKAIVKNIQCAAEAICKNSICCATKEERKLTAEFENIENPAGLTVSGNGTSRKQGSSALHSVASLIGHYSSKVLDIIIKSINCEDCENMESKVGTAEYEEWRESHECDANQEKRAGKMKVDGIREMFRRSEGLHDAKYLYYVGGEDCEIFKSFTESEPYDVSVKRKECMGHDQENKKKNENLNDLIWKIAPNHKINCSDVEMIEIATYIAAAIFNDGHKSLLDILQVLNVKIGSRAHDMCVGEDANRTTIANLRARQATEDSRTAKS